MSDTARSIKNIFSKAALRMLNACGKFVHNFASGFGIKLTRQNGSVIVSLDQESEGLEQYFQNLIHSTAHNANENLKESYGSSKDILPSNITLDETEWVRGKTFRMKKDGEGDEAEYVVDEENKALAGIRFQAVSRVVRAYDTDYFFWRWAYFDVNGALYKLSAEQGVFAEVNYDVYSNV